jgi:hypothetical protein
MWSPLKWKKRQFSQVIMGGRLHWENPFPRFLPTTYEGTAWRAETLCGLVRNRGGGGRACPLAGTLDRKPATCRRAALGAINSETRIARL